MIVYFKECLEQNSNSPTKIEVCSKEHYSVVPKNGYDGTVVQFSGDCSALQKELGIIVNDYEESEDVVNKISTTSLLYTPRLQSDAIALALKDRDPELYIGTSLVDVEKYCKDHEDTTVGEESAREFHNAHEWRYIWKMDQITVDGKQVTDARTAGFEDMLIYRRKGYTSGSDWRRDRPLTKD